MSAVNVSPVVVEVAAQVVSVVVVGLSLLAVYSSIRAFRDIRAIVGVPSDVLAKEDRKVADWDAAAAEHGGTAGLIAHMDSVEAEYQSMWAEQSAAEHSASVGLRPVSSFEVVDMSDAEISHGSMDSTERELVQALQSRGHSFEVAVSMVEARSDAVTRSILRARGE